MPSPIKKMGKAAASPFGALTKSTPAKPNNKPILILIVVGGVVAIWYLRNHSSANTVGKSTTGAAVSINGGSAPDQSQIDNLTAGVLALQGLQHVASPSPSGGTSTPQTAVWGQLPTTPWNDAWDANQSLMSGDWLAWMRKFTPEQLDPSLGGTRGLGGTTTTQSTGLVQNTTNTTKPVNMTGINSSYQSAINKVASYGGSINSVGPLTDSSGNSASSPTNLSLVDWYKYQYAKVAGAQNGTIIGESAAFLQSQGNDPKAYLKDTLQGGNISMFGPNAGPAQKAQDAAASAQAKKELGIT
jgi:hypothetical protein